MSFSTRSLGGPPLGPWSLETTPAKPDSRLAPGPEGWTLLGDETEPGII